jgi:L-ascorbate metabolism protein UlaG (beta-lactamase superfamily)
VDASARRGIDAVLVSHAHYDHLDLPSLEKLGKKLPVVVPRGLGGLVRKRRFESVLEVSVGETIRIGELTIRAVEAEHDGGRSPFGVSAQALGYVISGSRTVYFAGDTDLFDGMASLGALDCALLPVWGWGPAAGEGHLDPRKAARALTLLRPTVAIPVHWGTYRPVHYLNPAWLTEPAEQFRREAAALAPEVELRVLPLGGTTDVESTISSC